MTRDFADKSFVVIANFGRINNDQKIESIIFYDRSEKLEIFHDYEVRFLIELRFGNLLKLSQVRQHREFIFVSYGYH